MSTDHGVNIDEQPTGVKPPVQISAGLAVYFGVAPINSVDLTNVNKPVLCATLADFEAAFGALTHDFSWTLHEAASAHFEVYSVGPIVCVNILDPNDTYHVAIATDELHQLVSGTVQLHLYVGNDAPLLGIIESTVVVKNQSKSITYVLGTDYTLAFDANGFLVLTTISTGAITASELLSISFDYLDPSGVTADDVIGGYAAGVYTGLEVIDQVYPTLRLVPGMILAPQRSQTPTVAARMAVKAAAVDGAFRCQAVCDLSTDKSVIPTSADAPAWKVNNGFTSVDMVACWPKQKNGTDVYHASTVYACVANVTDAAVDGVPYKSPSNKAVIGTSAVLDDGTTVLLTRDQANALNAQGIVTLLNGFNGWKLWGNRTAGYPASTDPKDTWIPIRRMFNWIGNTIILTTDANIDDPINRRLIDLVVGTITSFINGLIAQEALVDGSIQFLTADNPTTDLANGIVTWDVSLTPPSPGQQLNFKLQYDPTALAALFAA